MKKIELNELNDAELNAEDAADVKGGPAYIKLGDIKGESSIAAIGDIKGESTRVVTEEITFTKLK